MEEGVPNFPTSICASPLTLLHAPTTALPFLSNTEVFMFPIAAILFIYVLNLVGYPFGLGWNVSRFVAYIYFEN